MKTVGFIDYFLNEWHADNYPAWIKEQSGGEYEVKYAYGHIEPPFEGGLSNAEWAKNHGIELVSSIDELIEKSDCIIVLSPDNCEMHYELSEKALKTGKRVYIDKTFAESKAEAQRIFELAEKHNTPCFSSSALRFSSKLAGTEKCGITSIVSFGGGAPVNYIIHQLEPLMILMGTDVERVMYMGNNSWELLFSGGRNVHMSILDGGFSMRINHGNTNESLDIDDDFFKSFIDALIGFFNTGDIPVSHNETIKIMAVRECCLNAMDKPHEWLAVL